ncbi:MAG: recombinase family protein [Acidimicrobiales bacterium]|jgi:DNA invertase Pin-like site-specific DNA recombinase
MTNATTTRKTTKGVARGTPTPSQPFDGNYAKRAVVYLRVSTVGQVNTDRDGEGFSLAAQRDACFRKAESLGAAVIDVYTDAGESARKADRPQLQEMLERLKAERDIDFVIVHKVDRLARNRGDDVAITMAIRAAGAQLVSVTENIDETPSGTLLHGIMSSIAEFYSLNLSNEIKKGTSKKAERGTYPGCAPIGYLNRQDLSGGNELRWIETDPERAPLIRWAFEAYASGDYTLSQLTEALGEQGLTTKPTPKHPSKPLVIRHVHNMLRSRFYLGLFTWGGIEYPGSHEPLVSIEMFATVQAIMASRRQVGDKPRKHPHYLKGTIFCARCGERLMFTQGRGRNGTCYNYFACLGRHQHRNDCDLPYLQVDEVEASVENYYDTIVLAKETVSAIHGNLLKFAKGRNAAVERRTKRERKRILDLETERRKLLQAHLAGGVPIDLLREEQERITRELANAGAVLANTEIHWETLQENLTAALGLASQFGKAYRRADATERRWFNQAVVESIHVDVGGEVKRVALAQPFGTLLDSGLVDAVISETTNRRPSWDGGSTIFKLVEVRGFEPLTS